MTDKRWDFSDRYGHVGRWIPAEAIGHRETLTLLVVLSEPRPTTRSIVARAGLRSTSAVHARLRELRRLGLVAWQDGKVGTLRPLVRVVPRMGHAAHVSEEWWG